MHQADLLDDRAGACADAVGALRIDAVAVAAQQPALGHELVVPGGAFLGLDAVLVAHLHQQLAPVEQARQPAAQAAAARLAGPRPSGPPAYLRWRGRRVPLLLSASLLIRKTSPQARASSCCSRRAIAPAHRLLVDFARQDARLQQPVGRVEVEIVGGHDIADRLVEVGLNRLVHHAQLVAQLAVGAGLVKHAQALLPEAAAHRQDRVILRKAGDIVLAMAERRAGQAGARSRPGWPS